MLNWFVWAGIGFIIGGLVSWTLTLGATGDLLLEEDLTGYSIGWILVGVILIVFGFNKYRRNTT